MKITYKEIKKVRAHLRKNWHDQAWHDYDTLPSTVAIAFALGDRVPYDTDHDIKERALSFCLAQEAKK